VKTSMLERIICDAVVSENPWA